jgi:hypothetical protein
MGLEGATPVKAKVQRQKFKGKSSKAKVQRQKFKGKSSRAKVQRQKFKGKSSKGKSLIAKGSLWDGVPYNHEVVQ